MKKKYLKTICLAAVVLTLVAGIAVENAMAYFTTYVTARGGYTVDLGFTRTEIEEKVEYLQDELRRIQNLIASIKSASASLAKAKEESSSSSKSSVSGYKYVSIVQVDGSHAGGLSYVPYDGYVAELHEGERVLTKEENSNFRSGRSGGGDTFIFNSPKAITPVEARRQMKKAKRDLEGGFA